MDMYLCHFSCHAFLGTRTTDCLCCFWTTIVSAIWWKLLWFWSWLCNCCSKEQGVFRYWSVCFSKVMELYRTWGKFSTGEYHPLLVITVIALYIYCFSLQKSPSHAISIRAVETNKYKVVEKISNEVLEEIEESTAFFQVVSGCCLIKLKDNLLAMHPISCQYIAFWNLACYSSCLMFCSCLIKSS